MNPIPSRTRRKTAWRIGLRAFIILGLGLVVRTAHAQDDPYEKYVKTSEDFQAVKQDKDWAIKSFPTWYYMPYSTKEWKLPYNAETGKWCESVGLNGAFFNRAADKNKLAWADAFKMHFYVDHTAGKGDLHMWDGGAFKPHKKEVTLTGARTKPVNDAMVQRLEKTIAATIATYTSSPCRGAYSLDDETSWGHFIKPCMWCVTDDKSAYPKWLKEIYGAGNVPPREGWISYSEIIGKLKGWDVAHFDASQLMDQWTFNDSYWNNTMGKLVAFANSKDPQTPCGYVGAEAPNAFGGYDYAKVMRKVQFLEAYNLGNATSIVRSFNPHNALPLVTTHFFKSVEDTVWHTWYYVSHGDRGEIGWVEGWFGANGAPAPWHREVAPTYLDAGQKIGPLMYGAEWIHDGVAIYYSHPSIQLGWIMDAESFGNTWANDNNDYKLGDSHLVRHAWENMLIDSGIQFNYVSYADLLQKDDALKNYKVLILPACLCLSDAEARKIKAFANDGGTVIADYMPGLWDQHGKGRTAGGVLDDMFGVQQPSSLKAADVFGGKYWSENDENGNYDYKNYDQLLTNKNSCIKDPSGFDKAIRKMDVNKVNAVGKGKAILMNLSPQWYNAYRAEGPDAAQKRDVFIKHVKEAGATPWVRIKGAGAKEFGYEITYWQKGDRTICFVVSSPEVTGNAEGGGNAAGLKADKITINLEFANAVKGVRDERSGKDLGSGKSISIPWAMDEAAVFSFAGAPPR